MGLEEMLKPADERASTPDYRPIIDKPNVTHASPSEVPRTLLLLPKIDSAKIRRLMGISGGLHSPFKGFW